tara:strand:- start:350 stop:706 length:357 start_codon:yes stop_codon:yes gene_type:complete
MENQYKIERIAERTLAALFRNRGIDGEVALDETFEFLTDVLEFDRDDVHLALAPYRQQVAEDWAVQVFGTIYENYGDSWTAERLRKTTVIVASCSTGPLAHGVCFTKIADTLQNDFDL